MFEAVKNSILIIKIKIFNLLLIDHMIVDILNILLLFDNYIF